MVDDAAPPDGTMKPSLTAFEALERDVADVLSRLEADASMERFRSEYKRLFLSLKKSHQSEKRSTRKCKDMAKELEQLHQSEAELRKELDGLRQDATDALEARLERDTSCARLESHLTEAKKSLSIAEEMLGTATRREEELKQEIEALTKSLSECTRGLEQESQQEVPRAIPDLDNARRTIEELEQQLRACTCTAKEEASQKAAAAGLDRQQQAKDVVIAHLEEQLEAKSIMQEEVESLRSKVDKSIAADVEDVADVAMRDAGANGTGMDADADIDAESNADDSVNVPADPETDISSLEKPKDEIAATGEDRPDKANTETIEAQQNGIASLKETMQSLENDIGIEQSLSSQMQLKNKALEAEQKRTKVELDAAKAELELRDKAIQGLTAKVIGIEETARTNKLRHALIDNSNQKKDIVALRAKMRTLEDEKREVKQELELVRSRLTKMEKDSAIAAFASALEPGAKDKSSAKTTHQILPHSSSPMRIPNNEKGEPMTFQELTRELVRTQHRLTRAECKVETLTHEIESPSPQNIHRWQKLESVDPAALKLLQKVASLQKRLIQKTDEASLKNDTIEKQKKVISELRSENSRHCKRAQGFDELSTYQSSIALKDQQLKSMAGELNMHQVIVEDMKEEISQLNRKLFNFKRMYFREKQRALLSECGSSGDTEAVESGNRAAPAFGAWSPSWPASAPLIQYDGATTKPATEY